MNLWQRVLRWFRSPQTLKEVFAKHKIKGSNAPSDCPDGWLHLVDQCFYELRAHGWDLNLFQVKEKFGSLRIYLGGDIADLQLSNIILRYENESSHTCGICGGFGKKNNLEIPRCDIHRAFQMNRGT